MRKLLLCISIALLMIATGCVKHEDPIAAEQTSTITISFHFPHISIGESMTKVGNNGEIFNDFYTAIMNGSLMESNYNLTFTETSTGESFQLNGRWNEKQQISVRMGTYSVKGVATAEGEFIQEKCSIVINDNRVAIDQYDAIVSLKAAYDCALIIFNDESISSVVNHTGNSDRTLFQYMTYFYAFINNSIWDGVSDSYLLGTRHDGTQFSFPTNMQLFEKGKFYVYDTSKTNSITCIYDLPKMQEGEINTQPFNEIWYTSTDGDIVIPNNMHGFLFNTYENGKGVIVFEYDIVGIDINAFRNCTTLATISLPAKINAIGQCAFVGCSNLISINIPHIVDYIGLGAFIDCSNLTHVTIPNALTVLEAIFQNCSSLTNVTIPESVVEMQVGVFYNCTNLKEVYCKPTTPPTAVIDAYHSSWDAFSSNASGRKIYVPRASVNAYKSAKGWSEYADAIVGYDFE